MRLWYIPSSSTESSCGGSHETCIELAVQLTTRTLEGVVGVDVVCTVMLSDLDDMMNVLLQCSFAVTKHMQRRIDSIYSHHFIIFNETSETLSKSALLLYILAPLCLDLYTGGPAMLNLSTNDIHLVAIVIDWLTTD